MPPAPRRPEKPQPPGCEEREDPPARPPPNGGDEAERQLLAGPLLKRCSGGAVAVSPRGVAHAAADGFAQGLFWRRRHVELSTRRILYWASLEEKEGGAAPRGQLHIAEVDDVALRHREVNIHFAAAEATGRRGRQRSSLSLYAASDEEALRWSEAIRDAAAARLHTMLPSGWDVGGMLSSRGPVRRVAKVELSAEAVQVVQHIVDHSFICKRTRDRRGQELPVRLEVAKVVCVQNVAQWMAYSRARDRVKEQAAATAAMPLVPEVLTGTLGNSGSLGLLDKAANEHWLFHGTRVAAAQGITDFEFRMDLAGSHRGAMYGKAVYLAECSSKADEYSEADEEGLCRMLLCRASLGAILIEREKHPAAPELEELCKLRYNSVCGDRWAAVGTFREFVLYEGSQVYPEYIIYYRRTSQADLLQAIGTIANDNDMDGVRRLVPHAARLAQTHPNPQVKYRISLLLGAHAATVVPALTECLRDDTALRRRTAAAALGHVADFTALSRASVISGCEDARGQEKSNPVAAAVPALTACLRDSHEGVRRAAAQALEQIGSSAASAVPALAASLSDTSEDVRCAAAKALEKMGADVAAPAVPALAETCLKDSNTSVQKAALAALGQLGTAAEPAVPALIECLKNANHKVRCAAAASLESLGPCGAASVPALLAVLEDSDVGVRTKATTALGSLGAYVSSNAPAEALCQRVLDSHEGVRAAAASALGRLGCASTVPVLCEALKDPNEDVRRASAIALGQCRGVATSAIPSLTKALKDSNEDVRQAAATSLGLFGAVATTATQALTACLSDTTVGVRKAAATSLGQIGHPARGAIAGLTERLKDPNEGVRKAALKSFEYLQRKRSDDGLDGAGADADACEDEDDDDDGAGDTGES
mmetsp:Transcript_148270/g.385403  ORF Transcript_148270/g.385403 Transcript_148270/m.385403 type:complete len:884 (-) Transcript_148270:73-2724(-)